MSGPWAVPVPHGPALRLGHRRRRRRCCCCSPGRGGEHSAICAAGTPRRGRGSASCSCLAAFRGKGFPERPRKQPPSPGTARPGPPAGGTTRHASTPILRHARESRVPGTRSPSFSPPLTTPPGRHGPPRRRLPPPPACRPHGQSLRRATTGGEDSTRPLRSTAPAPRRHAGSS